MCIERSYRALKLQGPMKVVTKVYVWIHGRDSAAPAKRSRPLRSTTNPLQAVQVPPTCWGTSKALALQLASSPAHLLVRSLNRC